MAETNMAEKAEQVCIRTREQQRLSRVERSFFFFFFSNLVTQIFRTTHIYRYMGTLLPSPVFVLPLWLLDPSGLIKMFQLCLGYLICRHRLHLHRAGRRTTTKSGARVRLGTSTRWWTTRTRTSRAADDRVASSTILEH